MTSEFVRESGLLVLGLVESAAQYDGVATCE